MRAWDRPCAPHLGERVEAHDDPVGVDRRKAGRWSGERRALAEREPPVGVVLDDADAVRAADLVDANKSLRCEHTAARVRAVRYDVQRARREALFAQAHALALERLGVEAVLVDAHAGEDDASRAHPVQRRAPRELLGEAHLAWVDEQLGERRDGLGGACAERDGSRLARRTVMLEEERGAPARERYIARARVLVALRVVDAGRVDPHDRAVGELKAHRFDRVDGRRRRALREHGHVGDAEERRDELHGLV
jgi:hypothetical protein